MRASPDREPARRLFLRTFCVATWALTFAFTVLALLPGYLVEQGGVGVRIPVASSPAWLAPLWLLVVTATLAAVGGLVWRRPCLGNALLWSMTSIGCAGLLLALTAAPILPPGGRVVVLPAAVIGNQVLLALLLVQLVLLPAACGLFALATRLSRPEQIARARVHRIGPR